MLRVTKLFVLIAIVGVSIAVGQSLAQREFDEPDNRFDQLRERELNERLKLELANNKPDLRTLALKRREIARKYVDVRLREFEVGKTTIADFLLEAQRRLMEAELTVAASKEERIAARENCWLIAKKAEMYSEAKFKAGTIGPASFYPVALLRVELEYELIKEKAE